MRLPYLVRKVLQLVHAAVAVVAFNFVLFRVLPGDPIQLYARSGRLTPEVVDQLRSVFGLDKPIWEQFLIYFKGLLHGDWASRSRTGGRSPRSWGSAWSTRSCC